MLSRTAAIQLGVALKHYPESSDYISPELLADNSIITPRLPLWADLLLEENPKAAKVYQILKHDRFSVVIGPGLLSNRRVIIDVVENGLVEIDWIPDPNPSPLDQIRGLIHKPEPQPCYSEYRWMLPWTTLKIRDSRSNWHPLTVNVDTGDNRELSLPPRLVKEFGLCLPDKDSFTDPDGPLETNRGEVEIFWQGRPRKVQCTQSREKNPPLVGMKLFLGNRIIIDNYNRQPVVKTARIPRPTF